MKLAAPPPTVSGWETVMSAVPPDAVWPCTSLMLESNGNQMYGSHTAAQYRQYGDEEEEKGDSNIDYDDDDDDNDDVVDNDDADSNYKKIIATPQTTPGLSTIYTQRRELFPNTC